MATRTDGNDDPESVSVFQTALSPREKLDSARLELLDFSGRNRLLNMPRSAKGARAIEIVDELANEIFRLFVQGGRPFTFVAGKAAASGDEPQPGPGNEVDEIDDLAQPEDDSIDERGVQSRHSDTRLQTRLTPKGLQKRLLDLYFDARTLEDEQGVNILYLTLGALKWSVPQSQGFRYAPLVLVPVALERGNAAEKFKLRVRQDDYAANLSLEALLAREHGIKLPTLEASDGFDLAAYFREVAEAVAGRSEWEILPNDVVVGFFSFAKFLMYRDLDPDTWPATAKITEQRLVRGLLTDGFDGAGGMIPEDANIDPVITPAKMLHILDCDSSQALAVHEVRSGRDMVIQGPPGTGKSQTIANIIAAAVADGKTVLFVAEKMAALEVVKRRLDATGVGDACLELHSSKANKRAVLEELRRTWDLGAPKGEEQATLNSRLLAARDQLNAHSDRMHSAVGPSGLTPFQLVGQLSRLRLDGVRPGDLRLDRPEVWSGDGFVERHEVVRELAERIEVAGRPDSHPWRGVGLASISPGAGERIVNRIRDLSVRVSDYAARQAELALLLEKVVPIDMAGLDGLLDYARRAADAPDIHAEALSAQVWDTDHQRIEILVAAGTVHRGLRDRLEPQLAAGAWVAKVADPLGKLGSLPGDIGPEALGRVARSAGLIHDLLRELAGLALALGRPAPLTLAEGKAAMRLGERVASAPEADATAFAADLWDAGVERAADAAEAVARLEEARRTVDGQLVDAAWDIDIDPARTALAAHGSSWTKVFSGEWRRANRLVRSVLVRPDAPLEEKLATLNALAKGKAAKRLIESESSFAGLAFGADWRGVRSASAPLRALVDWVRTLKGLGSEPRLIAARGPDRKALRRSGERVTRLLAECEALFPGVVAELGPVGAEACGGVADPDEIRLSAFADRMAEFHRADEETGPLFVKTPDRLSARVAALIDLERWQAADRTLVAGDALGRAAFRAAWRGDGSDWRSLEAAFEWIGANGGFRHVVGRMTDRAAAWRLAQELDGIRDVLLFELGATFDRLRLDLVHAFGQSSAELIAMSTLEVRLGEWTRSGERLFQWVAYRDRASRAAMLGCGDVVAKLSDGRLAPPDAAAGFEMAYYEAVHAAAVRKEPELGVFDGTLHGRVARDFAEMDRQRIANASLEVARAHHRRVPPRDGGGVGPLGVLRSELAKKRGHMPIRRLMETAAPAVQALKPVLMMSPLSVAQFLAPGDFNFDLLVMDEASQIQPVDALGAVARAKQVVVVGDPKQLPPTAFFVKMTSGTEEDEDGAGRVADIESILGLFTARGLPKRMLRWHYRSRHESLIATSNQQFYEGKLLIVPSPYTTEAGMGLVFHHVVGGLFDAGGTRTNVVEAKAVAQAIVAHARDHPELSLGVAAFSVAQRRAIVDQLEALRRSLPPETEAFFQRHPSEPFFVKNLENVQGDERDVVFISVGYGASVAGGRVPMRFGPVGMEGGDRRLNVLISRAKRRCEVFASMTDEDIEADFAASRKGVSAFRSFMRFARTGSMTKTESTGRDHDSVFQEQVARTLQARGYVVHRRVGLAGIFVDLAVADPDRPGRYLLGIECDGSSYHHARSARDRDRLRHSVLEDHGWSMMRIWSTDWFQRPNEQLAIIVDRIDAAKVEHDLRAAGAARRRQTSEVQSLPSELRPVERQTVADAGAPAPDLNRPVRYLEAVLQRPAGVIGDLHETPRALLATLVEEVVAIEGPVHFDEVVARIRDAWGLHRAGSRIQGAVERAVDGCVRAGRVGQAGSFLDVPEREVRVRDRSETASHTLRRCEAVPPSELEAAALEVVRANFGATDDQIGLAVSRAIGFKSTSAQLRELIAEAVAVKIRKGWLARSNGMVVLGEKATT
ncbi:DUF3320 domain-containing protein [Glacieibacterium megasporae]|uniref:DUF3320 domain-containing protein n=1 Tax=Glacieibacterium megasporae TaxID=2835787 RepID=UPI001C1E5774|nr:DUF3320 domain-containing protein [Polymorphobacter megasporae]UAJ08880.1 DUF3320 domain-containing protein [Polymorphobacter megasporae]